jgi:hypothetical protein
MIHVVAMKRLIGLPLLIHVEILWRSRSFKNRRVGVGAFVYRLHSPGCGALLKKTAFEVACQHFIRPNSSRLCQSTTTRILCDCCPDVTRISKHNRPVDFITSAIKNQIQPTGVQGRRTDLYIRTNVLVLAAVAIFNNSKTSGIRRRIDWYSVLECACCLHHQIVQDKARTFETSAPIYHCIRSHTPQ